MSHALYSSSTYIYELASSKNRLNQVCIVRLIPVLIPAIMCTNINHTSPTYGNAAFHDVHIVTFIWKQQRINS